MPSEPTPSVAQLLEQARNGDTDARNRLFEMCRSYVAISAKAEMASWLQAKVDASDLVQQTLLEAHRGLDNFRGQTEAEWLGWLRKIVAHNAADFVRRFHGVEKRKASREVPLQPGDDSEMGLQLSDGGDSPSKILIQKESELQIADAIAQLSEDYQQVILLRNMRRLPFDEVAREMGRSRPATQVLGMRAVKKLQELLPSTEIPVTRDPP
ncbi:MAG: sigma-70 family RNA polymerase sigma factor [Planctomycetota bacterium]|nr:sigma-70 family RNA polymerase sigma factor [Planctomycetota bacterium]